MLYIGDEVSVYDYKGNLSEEIPGEVKARHRGVYWITFTPPGEAEPVEVPCLVRNLRCEWSKKPFFGTLAIASDEGRAHDPHDEYIPD